MPSLQSSLFSPAAAMIAGSDLVGGDAGPVTVPTEPQPATATTTVPTPKVEMDPNFNDRLVDLQEHAAGEADTRPRGQQTPWFRPSGDWDGDLFAWQAMEEPFSRAQANEQGVAAIKDVQSPGVTGDIVIASTMLETLSLMERAFRVRHTMRRPRALAQMASRKKGHGQERGCFKVNGIEYVTDLLKQASKPQ